MIRFQITLGQEIRRITSKILLDSMCLTRSQNDRTLITKTNI